MNPLREILYWRDFLVEGGGGFGGLTENNAIAKPALILAEKMKPGIIEKKVKHHLEVGNFEGADSERLWPVQIPLRELGYLKRKEEL